MTTSRMFTTALLLFSTLFALVAALPAAAVDADLVARQDAEADHVSEVFTAGPELQAMITAYVNATQDNDGNFQKRVDSETLCNWPSSPVNGADASQLFGNVLWTQGSWSLSFGDCVSHWHGTAKTTLCGWNYTGKTWANQQDWAGWYANILSGCFWNNGNQVGVHGSGDRQMLVFFERS